MQNNKLNPDIFNDSRKITQSQIYNFSGRSPIFRKIFIIKGPRKSNGLY